MCVETSFFYFSQGLLILVHNTDKKEKKVILNMSGFYLKSHIKW